MTTLRRFQMTDLLKFNNVNMDPLTETYHMGFYMQYMSKWPEYFTTAEAPGGTMMGYIMGKAEGAGLKWHGHVTAVTVAPEFRRMGLANQLMDSLEQISDIFHKGYFVDLYVRKSNSIAIEMYKKFGYTVYREIIGYYSGVDCENAYDMRKSMSIDPLKKSMIPLPRPVMPSDDD